MAIEFKEYSEEEIKTGVLLGCKKCAYFNEQFDEMCNNSPCTSDEREDKKNGYYIEVPD
jgi:hypothetical protein